MGGLVTFVLALLGLFLAVAAVFIGVPVFVGTVVLLIWYGIHRLYERWVYEV